MNAFEKSWELNRGESKMLNTIIWDMDGTVLNTLYDLKTSMNYTLEMFNLKSHTIEEYRHAFGNGVRYAFEEVVDNDTPAELIDKMLPVFKEHYDKHCMDKTRPYEGIIDVMMTLKNRGYKQAIVSNKIDSAVQELYEKFFKECVDVVVGEKDGVRRKPAPDMVDEALKELDSSKDMAIYIGDSEVDLATARNSNLTCISVLWGFRDKDFLVESGATEFADSPNDILKIIDRL